MDISRAAQTNRILQIILFVHMLLLFRVWQLTYLHADQYQEFSQIPRKRTIIEKPERGAIFDRTGIPLALNRICYNACVYYRDLRQVPAVKWINGEKTYPRKEYITSLSTLLAHILDLDPTRVEDTIYAKAALFPHLPYTIKENISEKQYFRLRLLEKDWLGLHAEKGSRRYYPRGKSGCDILGFMGAINQREYLNVANEMHMLYAIATNDDLPIPKQFSSLEEVVMRLRELKEKAYSINDLIGKQGIEASLEKELRGYVGLSNYEINRKGIFLHKLKGSKESIPGKHCHLSISIALQEYAEQLLAESEAKREPLISLSSKHYGLQKEPWIRGGSIIALDPSTGEVLALASYPRFDPNDFTRSPKNLSKIHQWMETKKHIADIWDGVLPLQRERYVQNHSIEEEQWLTWEGFLKLILSPNHPLIDLLSSMTISTAVQIQEEMEKLLFFSEEKDPISLIKALFEDGEISTVFDEEEAIEQIRTKWSKIFSVIENHKDKLFAIDLCRLAVYSTLFSDDLLEKIGHLTLEQYFHLRQLTLQAEHQLKKKLKDPFEKMIFTSWRQENQKEFLKKMRKLEKKQKKAPRPYLDYLDQEKNRQYKQFWQTKGKALFIHFLSQAPNEYLPDLTFYAPLKTLCDHLQDELMEDFLRTVRSFKELKRPLYTNPKKKEKDLASLFYPKHGFGYSKSYAFQESCPLGSIFKLITAYTALEQNEKTQDFVMIDQFRWDNKKKGLVVGYNLQGTPYPRFYKGGRLPKSAKRNIGKINVVGALEQSSNPFFSILTADFLTHPTDLVTATSLFGFGEKSGIDLPRESAGYLPKDIDKNKTGLYSFAMGQHSLTTTPLQGALMLGSLSTGKLYKPQIIKKIQGTVRQSLYPLLAKDSAKYIEECSLLGLPFSPFIQDFYRKGNKVTTIPPIVRREVPILNSTKRLLFQGMDQTVWGKKGTARPSVIKSLLRDRDLKNRYEAMKHQFIGKTSTAEILQRMNFEPSASANMYKDVWFGAISLEENKPELVVIVYLRFAMSGKEAAPFAMQMIEKYRQLKQKL